MKKIVSILLILFFVQNLFAQQKKYGIGPLNLTYFSGEYSLEGLYRHKEYGLNQLYEELDGYTLNHSFKLNTKSFVWHPNFMVFSADFEYSPGNFKDDYLVHPNISEERTTKKIDLSTTFFKSKPVRLTLFTNLSETFQNREYLSSIKTDNKKWGANITSSKYIPISIQFNTGEQNQEELATGRNYNYESTTLAARASKSFSKFDKTDLNYSYNEFSRVTVFDKIYMNPSIINSSFNRISLSNHTYLDKEKKYSLRSLLINHDQKGSYAYKRLQATERISLTLPKRFIFQGTYNYFKTDQGLVNSEQHNGSAQLNHKLYKSLRTRGYVQYFYTNNTAYKENKFITGIDIQYSKKIPFGMLHINYNYSYQKDAIQSQSVTLFVLNEETSLSDNDVVLLQKPYININSIVVKDQTGSIVYQLDLDYFLVEMDDYFEIRRIPGGLILNNQTVYIDYLATQPGDHSFDSHHSNLNTTVILFKRKLELYYRRMDLDYFNIEQAELLTLNYLKKNTYGGAIKLGPFKVGSEYTDYNSTLVPYTKWRYFAEIQYRFLKRLFIVVNANVQNFKFTNTNIENNYNVINARLAYQINNISRIELQSAYRQQKGLGNDLEVLSSRIEYSINYRKINLSMGFEFYRRLYLTTAIEYNGGFIKLSRKF